MEYVALLRGINVGGNNKVVMSELREQIAAEGFGHVRTYINSGNLIFEAEDDAPSEDVAQAVEQLLELRYDFPIRLALLDGARTTLPSSKSCPTGGTARSPAVMRYFYTRGLGPRPRARAHRGDGTGG